MGNAAAAAPAIPDAATAPTATQLAKGALRRLAQAHLEPTPDNFSRAYAEESGHAAAPPARAVPAAADSRHGGGDWSTLIDRLARNLDRGGKQWTGARRKESLKRVLDGSRSDAQRLLQRLQSLMSAWEADQPSDPEQTGVADPPVDAATTPAGATADSHWAPLVHALQSTVRVALAPAEPSAAELADELAVLADAIALSGASAAQVLAVEAVCQRARRLFAHRHQLVEQLGGLCRELGASLTELAEDDSWGRGQCEALQARLAEGPSVRGVRAASALLAETRQHQQRVRAEREAARKALGRLIHDMLVEVGDLGEHTGRFQAATARHAEAIERADTLESLAGVVQALLEDTRVVQSAVGATHDKLQADRARSSELETQVRELESELRRLSQEVSTDALTQVANRRGLMQAFETEAARCDADGGALAVGLIDIDNFKKLNDSLGHAAGDVALKTLAASVRERLRPGDHLARFGGEEFVVLLPGLAVDEAERVLTRLQRSLSEALFLHDGREVFVTFSAGVTSWRTGEALQLALERADEALYEAKRNGKNRTCAA